MTEAPATAASRLGEAAALCEQGFLAAGQNLEAAVGILDRLIHHFGEYIAGLTGDALGDTCSNLATAGSQIQALAALHRQDAAALEALGAIILTADRRIAALEPIARAVATLSLSARVVAGGMGNAAADFLAFAGDIRRAAEHAGRCLLEAREAVRRADQDLGAARDEAAAFMQRHGDAMAAIPPRLARNLQSLTAQRQLAADAAGGAHRQFEDVRRHVAAQIMALQLGDITRQRLEHILTALQLAPEPQHPVGALLAAQLTDAADELLREGARVESGLHNLAHAAREIGRLGANVHSESRGGGFVAALEADISQTARLFVELDTGDAATQQRMVAVLQAASALASRLASVQAVQEDIRVMGLNATLKCGRLGAIGRPLAAVAQELRLCSGQFGALAASVLQDLDHVRSIATQLRDRSRDGQHASMAEATAGMLAPLQRLDALDQELRAALSGLQEDADAVGGLVEAAVTQFTVHHGLAATLREAAAALASSAKDAPCDLAVLDRIASGYTMAREREVHARFAPLPQTAAADAQEDVLF